VRPRKDELRQRLGHEHLTARRTDAHVELRHEPVRVPVGRDHDPVGLECVERLDAAAFADLGTRTNGRARKPTHPARRLERAVRRMHQAGDELPSQRRAQVGGVEPRGVEPVVDQRIVLRTQLGRLRRVDREAEAPDHTKRVAGDPTHPLERPLCQLPVLARPRRPELVPRDVVAQRAPAQREAAVAAARAARDLPRLVQAHPHASGGERERTGAASHAAAHDLDLGRAVLGGPRQRLGGILEPVRRHPAIVVTARSCGRPRRTR
jgi:hypothetical protein